MRKNDSTPTSEAMNPGQRAVGSETIGASNLSGVPPLIDHKSAPSPPGEAIWAADARLIVRWGFAIGFVIGFVFLLYAVAMGYDDLNLHIVAITGEWR